MLVVPAEAAGQGTLISALGETELHILVECGLIWMQRGFLLAGPLTLNIDEPILRLQVEPDVEFLKAKLEHEHLTTSSDSDAPLAAERHGEATGDRQAVQAEVNALTRRLDEMQAQDRPRGDSSRRSVSCRAVEQRRNGYRRRRGKLPWRWRGHPVWLGDDLHESVKVEEVTEEGERRVTTRIAGRPASTQRAQQHLLIKESHCGTQRGAEGPSRWRPREGRADEEGACCSTETGRRKRKGSGCIKVTEVGGTVFGTLNAALLSMSFASAGTLVGRLHKIWMAHRQITMRSTCQDLLDKQRIGVSKDADCVPLFFLFLLFFLLL